MSLGPAERSRGCGEPKTRGASAEGEFKFIYISIFVEWNYFADRFLFISYFIRL